MRGCPSHEALASPAPSGVSETASQHGLPVFHGFCRVAPHRSPMVMWFPSKAPHGPSTLCSVSVFPPFLDSSNARSALLAASLSCMTRES
ncbi:hypothetical protein CEP53_012007 [Fusarium sp. AF-6]|nr:hypothetical protein CEP53_012007 [Fusarium sp. AF-6]